MIVFIRNVTEFAKGLDVMNVKFLAQLLLGYAAVLASMAVATAGKTARSGGRIRKKHALLY